MFLDRKKKEEDFFDFRKYRFGWINEKIFADSGLGEDKKDSFVKHIDPRYLLLHETTLENLIYLRESYWYYMDFQLNTLVCSRGDLQAHRGNRRFLKESQHF